MSHRAGIPARPAQLCRASLFALAAVALSAAGCGRGVQPNVLFLVLDTTRAPIAGARVTAAPAGTGSPASAVTDERGEFTLQLAPGSYTVAIEADGFRPAVRPVNAAKTSEAPREFTLQVEGFTETVNVNAPGSLEFADSFCDASGEVNEELPTTTARVTIGPAASGRTQMTITSVFDSVAHMEQLVEMGMVEGLTQSVNQIDALLEERAAV